MKTIILLLCTVLLSSCATRSPTISQQERQELLTTLERKVNSTIGMPYGDLVIKYDLLEPAQQQTTCPVSTSYLALNEQQMTREAYKARLRQLEETVTSRSHNKESLLTTLYRNVDRKTQHLTNIAQFAKLTPKDNNGTGMAWQDFLNEGAVGGPFITTNSTKRKKRHVLHPLEEEVLNNFIPHTNEEALNSKLETLRKISSITDPIPFINPLPEGRQTSGFSIRKDPINGKKAIHEGIDFVGKQDARIYSTANGIVSFAGKLGSYGNLVMIKHSADISTRYAHLQSIFVKEGENITAGQLLGLQGNTGRTTGPHLHYEIRVDERPRNPAIFLELGKGCVG